MNGSRDEAEMKRGKQSVNEYVASSLCLPRFLRLFTVGNAYFALLIFFQAPSVHALSKLHHGVLTLGKRSFVVRKTELERLVNWCTSSSF